MNILMLTANDPAGMGIAFCRAINRLGPHQCRLVTTDVCYEFHFETDLHVPDREANAHEEVRELLHWADVVHFHILADDDMRIGPLRVGDHLDGKLVVHHHHGHPHFRAHPDLYRNKYEHLGRRVLVSTPDLRQGLPEAAWVPNLVPLDTPALAPAAPADRGQGLVVVQSPTREDLKNTTTLQAAVKAICRRRPELGMELDLVRGLSHRQCLARKQRAHIAFDHMQGYYGVSSLETMAQATPTIAGIDSWCRNHIVEFTGCKKLPWVIATDQPTLEKQLEALGSDPAWREARGAASRHFMEQHWSEQRVLDRLLASYAAPAPWPSAVSLSTGGVA